MPRSQWQRGGDVPLLRGQPNRVLPVAAAAVVLVGGSFVVVLVGARTLGVLFLAFPFLGWAALRFQLAGAAPDHSRRWFAIDAAVRGYGPFAGDDLLTNMITLQLYNGSVALSALRSPSPSPKGTVPAVRSTEQPTDLAKS